VFDSTNNKLNASILESGFRNNPFWYTDFTYPTTAVGASGGFEASNIWSGSLQPASAGLITGDHPGVFRFDSSTTPNSGYKVATYVDTFTIGGGEEFNIIYNLTTLANSTYRFGFHDSTSSSDAVDGCYLEIDGSGVGTGKTANNSTRSSTATTYTHTAGTWYRLKIKVNSAATSVAFTVYDDTGTVLWTNTLTTNIPTGDSTRKCGAGFVATNSGSSSVALLHVDYMSVSLEGLSRGGV
jgi:hypothetical protein